ncbi:hypothetical protein ACWEQP_02320 [Streptomyces sp. NPDC004044]
MSGKDHVYAFGLADSGPKWTSDGTLGYSGTPNVVGDRIIVTTDSSLESYDLHAEGDAGSKSVKLYSGRPKGRTEPELIASGDTVFPIFADGTALSGYLISRRRGRRAGRGHAGRPRGGRRPSGRG